jgi:molecular chaperone HtpG
VATDHANRDAIAKLLRFESSLTESGEVVGLGDYVKRMKEDQKAIYYQVAPSRAAIEGGPYLEAFKSKGYEVLFLYESIDEYVVSTLPEFECKKLQAVNSPDVDLGEVSSEGESLSEDDTQALAGWLKESLGDGVEEVRAGKRLVSAPALAITPEGEMTPQLRQMMKALKPSEVEAPKVILEINPRHELVKKVNHLRQNDADLAKLLSEQILDNALLSAGLLDDPQRVVTRTEKIMARIAG